MSLEIKDVKRLNKYKQKVLNELHKAFHEHHSDRQIALSFSIGVFITALPTLGTGFILFFVLAKAFTWISKLALIASAIVLNPIVKPVFWLASINLGGIIFTRQITFTTEPETVLAYLIVGNLVIALISAVIAYFFALNAVRRYREEGLDIVEELDEAVEEKASELE